LSSLSAGRGVRRMKVHRESIPGVGIGRQSAA
jgi:hypothetical protein